MKTLVPKHLILLICCTAAANTSRAMDCCDMCGLFYVIVTFFSGNNDSTFRPSGGGILADMVLYLRHTQLEYERSQKDKTPEIAQEATLLETRHISETKVLEYLDVCNTKISEDKKLRLRKKGQS